MRDDQQVYAGLPVTDSGDVGPALEGDNGGAGLTTFAVAESVYTHVRPEDLVLAAAALGKIHNPSAVTKM